MSYNGLDILIAALSNDGGLTNHLIGNTLFVQPDKVREQAKAMLDLSKDGKLPVRFSTEEYVYCKADMRRHKRLFSNKTEAVRRSESDDIYTTVRPGIRVMVDKDGNYWVRRAIRDYTGHTVSAGAISTIKNYMISHIWANTADPYFFTSLWNIALTPLHCSFILDKPDEHHPEIRNTKELFKAICWQLYRPNELMHTRLVDEPDSQMLRTAQSFIDNKQLIFI
ncbi:MAG: hypothetical protein J1D86_03480 [Alistipes sp.]|nr:hypothetical protein [Alistipes sp.]